MKISEKLKNYQDIDLDDLFNEIDDHFEKNNIYYDCDVGREATSIYSQMFEEEAEINSPIDALFLTTAVQAADGVFGAVAKMLGVDCSDLKCITSYWYEDREKPPSLNIGGELNSFIERLKVWEEDTDMELPSFLKPMQEKETE